MLYTREVKYLNNIIEQDHRGIKTIVKPMMGFKAFHAGQATLADIELHRMLWKGQYKNAINMAILSSFMHQQYNYAQWKFTSRKI